MKTKNKNYINNEWVNAAGGDSFEVENPFTEEIIATVPYSKEKDVDAAVTTAKSAWKEWKTLGSLDMRDLLREVAVKSRKHD